jgi:hypothetical protein
MSKVTSCICEYCELVKTPYQLKMFNNKLCCIECYLMLRIKEVDGLWRVE